MCQKVFNSCTILFSDVVGFASLCSQLQPMDVVSMLNEMYTKFDKCLELHDVYKVSANGVSTVSGLFWRPNVALTFSKVETIGDAYMVVSGLPERNPNHAVEIMQMGFDMLAAISTLKNPLTKANDSSMMIRIGRYQMEI